MSLMHRVFNLMGFLFMLFAVFFVQRHKVKMHHLFLFLSLLSVVTAFTLFMVYSGGVVDFHCTTRIVVIITLFSVALSGCLFRSIRLKRQIHEVFGIAGLIPLFLQLVYGLVKSFLL